MLNGRIHHLTLVEHAAEAVPRAILLMSHEVDMHIHGLRRKPGATATMTYASGINLQCNLKTERKQAPGQRFSLVSRYSFNWLLRLSGPFPSSMVFARG